MVEVISAVLRMNLELFWLHLLCYLLQEYQGTVIQCPKISSKSSLSISYNWIKDQTTPINSRLTPYIFISGDGQLYFSEVTRGDNGMYYCMATLTYPTDRDNYAGSFQSPSRISTGIPLQVQGAQPQEYWMFKFLTASFKCFHGNQWWALMSNWNVLLMEVDL